MTPEQEAEVRGAFSYMGPKTQAGLTLKALAMGAGLLIKECERQRNCLEAEVERLERELEEEVGNREQFEGIITRLAGDAGCPKEWSNLHAHGDCITNEWADKLEKSNLQIEERKQRVLAWLGFWRDKMPAEAVSALQSILLDSSDPGPKYNTEPEDGRSESIA